MANASIKAAFERMWQHITSVLNNKSDSDHSHIISDVTDLQEHLDEKTEVQIITSTDTEDLAENLSILKIYKLTEEQYQQKIDSGDAEDDALYLTPDEELDLSQYATKEYVDSEIASIPTPNVSGQIETHNTNPDAHEDIRALIASSVSQKSQVQIITWGDDD